MSSLLDSDVDNFFFDIEDTILADNIFYSCLRTRFYSKLLYGLSNGTNFKKIIAIGKNYIRYLLDPQTSDVLQSLVEKKKRIFALTSGFLSMPKMKKLLHLNIVFEYVIFTNIQHKGPILVKFLEQYNIHGKCAFIDNDLSKIQNVYDNYQKHHHHTKNAQDIEIYWFQRQQPQVLNKQTFTNYWSRVIATYRNQIQNHAARQAANTKTETPKES